MWKVGKGSRVDDTLDSEGNYKNGNGKSWTKAFGSAFERGDDSKNLAYDHDYNGFISGYEWGAKNSRYGVLLGLSQGEIKTDSQSFKSDVDSVFAGIYRYASITKHTFLNTSLITGYEKYKNKRDVVDNINGSEVARSDLGNLFITPSIAIENRIKLYETFEIKPKASLTYTASYFGSSNESGTTSSNMSIKSREAKVLNARAGVSGVLTLMKNYKINLGVGFDSRMISEDKAEASLSGTGFKFDTDNDDKVNGHYMNIGLNFVGFKDLTFEINAEARSTSGNEEQKSANLSPLYRF